MRLNQSTSKNKSRKKIYAIIAMVILALGLVSLGLLYGNYKYNWFNTVKSPSDVNLKPTTEEQKNNGDSIKEESVQGKPNTETPNQGDTGNTTQASSVNVTITSPTTQSINYFSVRAFIDKLTTDGQCTLVLTNASNKTVTKVNPGLQASNQISACSEFKVPASELSTGTWNLSVSYDSVSSKGSSTQTIIIE